MIGIDNNMPEIELPALDREERLEGVTVLALRENQSLKLDSRELNEKIETMFQAYASEDFEDGTDSEFISELTAIIQAYGSHAVEVIRRIVFEQNLQPHLGFETLRWMGRVSHPESFRSRLFFLESCLGNPSRLMRDGAALGLVSMKDAHAIPYLHEAIAREKIEDLRKDLETALSRLNN